MSLARIVPETNVAGLKSFHIKDLADEIFHFLHEYTLFSRSFYCRFKSLEGMNETSIFINGS